LLSGGGKAFGTKRRVDTDLRAHIGVGGQIKFFRAHKKGISKNRKREGR